MAQYAVLIYGSDSAHAPEATAEDLESETGTRTTVDSGVMVAAYALTPRDMATSVREDIITDGPFIDSKEVVAGFYVIEAPDLDAALAIVRSNPVVREGGGVEVRPVHSSYLRPRTREPRRQDRTHDAAEHAPPRQSDQVTAPRPSRRPSPTHTVASGAGCSPRRRASPGTWTWPRSACRRRTLRRCGPGPRRDPG